MMLSPTIKPDASSTPSCFVPSGLRRAIGAAIEELADDRADHDHERARGRQINSEPDREWRNAHVFRRLGKNCIEHDDGDADVGADPDQTPIDIRRDDALARARKSGRLAAPAEDSDVTPRPGAPTKP